MTHTAEECESCKAGMVQHLLRSASRKGHKAHLPDKARWEQICAECHASRERVAAEEVAFRTAKAAEYQWRCSCGFALPLTYEELPWLNRDAWRLCPMDDRLMFRMAVDKNGHLLAPDDDGKARELDRQGQWDAEAAMQNLQAMHTQTPSN